MPSSLSSPLSLSVSSVPSILYVYLVVLLVPSRQMITCSDAAEIGRWWTAPNTDWSPVPPDYNWRHRRTGIRPEWSANFGTWLHYRPGPLTSSWWRRQRGSLVINPRPWTVGRMCKFLRQVPSSSSNKNDDDAFELKSVYEQSAKGDWAKGFIRRRDQDAMGDDVPLWEMEHVFRRTPYRITTLPSVLPPSLRNDDAVCADASRVTIVMPDGCTVSGPRWLPTTKQTNDMQQWKGDDENGTKSMRFQFVELWLAEGTAESDKVGAFIMYDGITGELVQMFRMKETLIPVGSASSEGRDPNQAISLDALEAAIEDKDRMMRRGAAVHPALSRALRRGQSLADVFRRSHFTSFSGRAVRCTSPKGAEEECRKSKAARDGSSYMFSPILMEPNPSPKGHVDIRFNDGVYLCIPRSFDSDAFTDDDEICMELGCLRLDGGFHRVRMMGSRAKNFDVCVYERWN